jgi:hypothetical protein
MMALCRNKHQELKKTPIKNKPPKQSKLSLETKKKRKQAQKAVARKQNTCPTENEEKKEEQENTDPIIVQSPEEACIRELSFFFYRGFFNSINL